MALPAVIQRVPAVTRASGDVAGTAASKPLLVGRSTISDINKMAPGMGAVVAREGLKSRGFSRLAKTNPKVAVGVAIAAGLGSMVAYEDLVSLAAEGGELAQIAIAAISQIDETESALQDGVFAAASDGDIGGQSSEDVMSHYQQVSSAKAIFKRACAAARGRDQLLAIYDFLRMDPDLIAIVTSLDINE